MITKTEKQVAAFFAILCALAAIAWFTVEPAYGQKPPSPPGQGECEHGNSQKPCKDDPQPDRGKDCEEHGPKEGGVNEDHCKGTPPVDPPCTVNCTPVDPPVDPPKEPPTSTPDPTKPETPETPPATPEAPASPESPSPSAPETPDAPSAETPDFQEGLEKDVEKQAKKNGATSAPSATSQTPATELPYTGLPLGLMAALGAALSGAGLWLRRRP
jgi:hypothetical protein